MTQDKVSPGDASRAGMGIAVAEADAGHCGGVYHVICRDAGGREVWRDEVRNLWTTAGKNFALDTVFAASAYTAAWYIGLISSASYAAVAAGDTMASHAGWLEAGGTNAPAYSETTRRAPSWNAASAGSKAMSAGVVFTFTSAGTVKGLFLSSSATKDGTTGTLFSGGLFSGGDQVVSGSGTTLTVTYTPSLT